MDGIDDAPQLSIWGGFIDGVLRAKEGLQLLENDPVLKPLWEKLQCLEKAQTSNEVALLFCHISFTQLEQNFLNSPLLDQLIMMYQPFIEVSRLMYAVGKGYYNAVKYLLERGYDMATDRFLLGRASAQGYTTIVQLLLDHGANVHANGDFALITACTEGHVDIVKILLDYHANIHVDNDVALRYASKNGHTDVVRLLLAKGANVHTQSDCPLRWASMDGHTDTVSVLLEYGANVHAINDQALIRASENGHTGIVRLLLDHGADVHTLDDSPLQQASQSGQTEVVRLLLSKGANIHADNDYSLRSACQNAHIDTVRLLLEKGAGHVEQALNLAVQHSNSTIIGILVDHVASIAAQAGSLNHQ